MMVKVKAWREGSARKLGARAAVLAATLAFSPHLPAATLLYSTYFGGSGFEDTRAIATDSSGNVYIAGSTALGLFPIKGALQSVYGGGSTDAFIAKLNPTGTSLIYATFLGGSDADVATALAVDSAGSVYVVGNTLSSDFPTSSPLQSARAGSVDGFFAKLSPSGSSLIYASYLGGSGDDFPNGVVVSSQGAVSLVGSTDSPNFPTVQPFQPALGGQTDAFVSFLNVSATALTFSTYLGGLGTETGTGIALDPLGGVVVVGATGSSNFPTVSPFQASFGGGGFDAFVAKLGSTGTLSFASYLGGFGRDEAAAVALTSSGAALVAGYTLSSDFPGTAGGLQASSGGGADAFVAEIAASGSSLTQATYLGGSGNDRAQSVSVAESGLIQLVGFTDSSNFPTTPGAPQPANGGGSDAFVALLSPTQLSFSSYVGGTATDKALGVSSDKSQTFAVVGNTSSANFPTTPGGVYPARIGSQDAFVQRYSLEAKPTPLGPWWTLTLLAASLATLITIWSRKEHRAHRAAS
jgi:hypothetical protein